ncbi:hypothetical protein [Aridibaculum aurantiacum]|uniref:hypothetical protein n=1 Tax=Aridibaculum aurantiacum TaxID=2810307 RepID=UPI001A97BCD3|nr:hypothetical protein [Aridibaculum aurantiacum]
MEIDFYIDHLSTTDVNHWYSEEFIVSSLVRFLKENGYKIHKDKAVDRSEKVVIASKYFTKEVIEIKGFPAKAVQTGSSQKSTNSTAQAKHWFSDALFSSFVNFGKYYSNENAEIAMALPNAERYRAIIEKVQDYFTINNLHFKIYLVNEDGQVEVSNLNENMRK